MVKSREKVIMEHLFVIVPWALFKPYTIYSRIELIVQWKRSVFRYTIGTQI